MCYNYGLRKESCLPSTKKQTLILVDDDCDIQDLVTAYFKPKNFDVICFTDPGTAIQESLISGTRWDVLLTDFHFRKMSEVDFTVQIKKTLPDLPIILITPLESAEIAVEAIQIGAYDLVVKPIHFPQLQIAVDRALKLRALKVDLIELRERVKTTSVSKKNIIGKSPKFLQALDVAQRVAVSTAHILISGESGTGKEVFAKFIHAESKRLDGPFVAINCSAIPENLLESELFGHAKGSFTGAHDKKMGLFEEAQDGTLFLDEIGDLSLSLQAKLLRVLQEKKIKRVGENQYREINCRIISATHKNLAHEVNESRFREDLYFRLNVIPITIPPLRERTEDIIPLAECFLRKYALENGSVVKSFSKASLKFILENQWRGNVRELENTIERAVVLCPQPEIETEYLISSNTGIQLYQKTKSSDDCKFEGFTLRSDSELATLDEVIQQYIEYAIEKNGGARDKTAKDLGIDRKTLYNKLRKENTLTH